MENQKLRRLAVFIENEEKEDVIIIYAEPSLKVKYLYIVFSLGTLGVSAV
jgi:hypothetical protein